jgi:hypothetical protein
MKRLDQFRGLCAAAVLASLCIAASGTVRAEDAPVPAAPPAAAVQAPAAPAPGAGPAQTPANRPGFLHQLGVWWNDSFGDFDAKMRAAKDKIDAYNKQQDQAAREASSATEQALKDAAQATKDAATAVVKLPATRMFELTDRCAVAGNGAPDCQATANNACHAKGFGNGRPLDVSSAQECPPRVMLSGRPPVEGECRTVTTLLRVVCQ